VLGWAHGPRAFVTTRLPGVSGVARYGLPPVRRGCSGRARDWDADVRGVLHVIGVPTLVVHAAHDRVVSAAAGRFLAEQIPGARYVEVASGDHLPFFERPDEILDEIEEFVTGGRPTVQADRRLATVVVTDICRSTERLREVGDQRWHALLDEHDGMIERQASRYGGRVVKSLGDGALLVFDGPTRAIRCAQAIRDGATAFGLEVRAGLHTGEVEVRGDDLAGIAVHLASRVAAQAEVGEVLASRTVVDLVAGSGIEFRDRGAHMLKGIENDWQLFAAN
jgi:class 3 adenylate cyclase